MQNFLEELKTKCAARQQEWDPEAKFDMLFRALEFVGGRRTW